MKKHVDNKIEQLTDRLMKDSALERPSLDFTDVVMQRVHKVAASHITEYKPLISKQGWVGIVLTFFFVIYVIFTNSTPAESSWLYTINFDRLFDFKFMDSLFSMNVSKTVMYTILLFGLMLFVQIPLLKNHFDKRFNM